jgi:hypothetical protein
MAERPTLEAGVGFRTIAELAVRCGHYCWLENRLFALTGQWASGPAAGAGAARAADAEVRVLCSQMSAWHGFLAGQWHERLPVRAGVEVQALILPPPGGVTAALDLLGTMPGLPVRLGGLIEPILTALLAAYDDEAVRASPISEGPVIGLLELARCRGSGEIEVGREVVARAAAVEAQGGAGAGPAGDAGTLTVTELRERLQRLLGADRGIFPAARAS